MSRIIELLLAVVVTVTTFLLWAWWNDRLHVDPVDENC
jgi:hypothetical protein